MTDYLTLVSVGVGSGIGSAIGAVIVKIWVEPYVQRLHEHTKKIVSKDIFDKF